MRSSVLDSRSIAEDPSAGEGPGSRFLNGGLHTEGPLDDAGSRSKRYTLGSIEAGNTMEEAEKRSENHSAGPVLHSLNLRCRFVSHILADSGIPSCSRVDLDSAANSTAAAASLHTAAEDSEGACRFVPAQRFRVGQRGYFG